MKKRTSKKKERRVRKTLEGPNKILSGLAALGMALTAYLVITGWLDNAPLLCDDGSTCDIVQKSRWGTLLMLPTSLWGFMTYATLFYIGFNVRNIGLHWKSAWIVSMIGFGYSLYLIAISFFVIKATCIYCIASFLIMSSIFGVIIFQRPKNISHSYLIAFAKQTVVITVIIIGGIHLHYSGIFDPKAGAEDPYLKGLAEHLTVDNAKLYGAFW